MIKFIFLLSLISGTYANNSVEFDCSFEGNKAFEVVSFKKFFNIPTYDVYFFDGMGVPNQLKGQRYNQAMTVPPELSFKGYLNELPKKISLMDLPSQLLATYEKSVFSIAMIPLEKSSMALVNVENKSFVYVNGQLLECD